METEPELQIYTNTHCIYLFKTRLCNFVVHSRTTVFLNKKTYGEKWQLD